MRRETAAEVAQLRRTWLARRATGKTASTDSDHVGKLIAAARIAKDTTAAD